MRGMLALLLTAAAILVLATYVAPLGVAVFDTLTAADWGRAALDGRRVGLLLRGLTISVAAGLMATAIGAGLASGFSARRSSLRALSAWLAASVLLIPPYIYAYGWSLVLLPAGVAVAAAGTGRVGWLSTWGRAIVCLGAWTAPIAAFLLHRGWLAAGRGVYRMALLDSSGGRALVHAVLPCLSAWILLALLVCSALGLTEFSVCHLCLVQTWNTEILAEILAAGRSGEALLLAWPLVVLVGLLAVAACGWRGALERLASMSIDEAGGSGAAGGLVRRLAASLLGALAIAILAAPVVILELSMHQPAAFVRAWQVYPGQWSGGLTCALGSAAIALLIALGIDAACVSPAAPPVRRAWPLVRAAAAASVVVSLLALAAPPALVGDALAAAYVHVPFISDHGLIVSLVGAARFGFVAVAVLLLASRGRIVELERMAAADGANAWQSLTRVRWAVNLPAIVIAAGLVALLAFGEVAATQLVRPPGVGNLAMTLLNAIHFGRDDEVIAMTLCAVGFVGVGAGALLVLAARWARNTSDSARHEGL